MAEDADLLVRVDHNQCSRRGLGLDWSEIFRILAATSFEDASLQILERRREAYPNALLPRRVESPSGKAKVRRPGVPKALS